MRERRTTFRREELEQLPSAELNRLVRSELEKDSIDRETVMQILRILEDREPKDPILEKEGSSDVWEDFQTQFAIAEDSCSASNHVHTSRKNIPRIAKTVLAATLVIALLVFAPPAMGYGNVFALIGRWTQDVFELFDPASTTEGLGEYVFKSDHPGLQQVYNKMLELGVTQPVVPTWLPEGYELKNLKVITMPTGTRINAYFIKQSKEISFAVMLRGEDLAHKYEKNDGYIEEYGLAGITHYIMQNGEKSLAVWAVGNSEFSITTTLGKETLCTILDSIYMEVEE